MWQTESESVKLSISLFCKNDKKENIDNMIKSLRDYIDPYFKTNITPFAVSWISEAWPKVLTEQLKEIEMKDDEFYAFVSFFILQLPHDWDGKSFMGVKIIRI